VSLLWAERRFFLESESSLAALRAQLEPLARKRVRASVVLSNRLVRYAIVPFDPAVSGPGEELALARFHFTRIHGERAKSWAVRLSPGRRGAARLASAVDPALLAAIGESFPRERRPRLASIQPYLMEAFNLSRDALARENGWLVLLEPGRACLALASPSGWETAQSLPLEGDDEWLDLLEREALRARASPRLAYTRGVPRDVEAPGWRLARLA